MLLSLSQVARVFAVICAALVSASVAEAQTPGPKQRTRYVAALTSDTGTNPYGGLLAASDGNFYGTTFLGGTYNYGTLYRVTPSGEITVLYAFDGGDVGWPGSLIQASDGAIYGTAFIGGPDDDGCVYRMTLDGQFSILHYFTDDTSPSYGVIQARDGALYGTTISGGSQGSGIAFRLGLDGGFEILSQFDASTGESPNGKLLEGDDGNLYGTTRTSGPLGEGTLFSIPMQGGNPVVLHAFTPDEGGGQSWGSIIYSPTHDRIVGTVGSAAFSWSPSQGMKVVTGQRSLSPLAIGPNGQGYIAYAQAINGHQSYVVELDDQLQQHVLAAIKGHLADADCSGFGREGQDLGRLRSHAYRQRLGSGVQSRRLSTKLQGVDIFRI